MIRCNVCHASAVAVDLQAPCDCSPVFGPVADRLLEMLATEHDRQTAMVADKPNVVDGHSDGKRVRYVRSLERAAVLAEVFAMLTAEQS